VKVWMDCDSYYPFFIEKKESVFGYASVELDPEIVERYRRVVEELDQLTDVIRAAWNEAQKGRKGGRDEH